MNFIKHIRLAITDSRSNATAGMTPKEIKAYNARCAKRILNTTYFEEYAAIYFVAIPVYAIIFFGTLTVLLHQ